MSSPADGFSPSQADIAQTDPNVPTVPSSTVKKFIFRSKRRFPGTNDDNFGFGDRRASKDNDENTETVLEILIPEVNNL